MARTSWVTAGFLLMLGLFTSYLLREQLQATVVLGWSTPSLRLAKDMSPDIAYHLLATAGRSVFILVWGSLLACALSGAARALRMTGLADLMSIIAAIPPLVWVPLSLAAFGLHEWAFTAPAILFAGALLTPSLLAQASTVPSPAIEMLVILGRSRWEIRKSVYLPHLIGGMAPQIALTFALLFGMSAVVEYLASFDGVGRVLRSLSFSYEMRDLLIVTGVTTLLLWVAQHVLRRALAGVQCWL